MLRAGQRRRKGTSLVPLLVMGLMALSCEYGRGREREKIRTSIGTGKGEGMEGIEERGCFWKRDVVWLGRGEVFLEKKWGVWLGKGCVVREGMFLRGKRDT